MSEPSGKAAKINLKKVYIKMKNRGFLFSIMIAGAMAVSSAQAATVVTDFSNFTESGNLLGGSNSREQSFTPSGASVTIASVSGSGAGQENYLSNEFSAFTVGDRVSVDWGGTDTATTFEQFGLQIGSATSGADKHQWLWRPVDNDASKKLYLYYNNTIATFAYTTAPDTLFIEKTATGWSAGSITGASETIYLADYTGGGDGSTLGLYSDMRGANPKTLSNLTIIPEPSAAALLGLGGLALLVLRRRPA